jgi:cytochrome c oxidase assembly protein subunit 15
MLSLDRARPVARWLLVVYLLIFAMVLVGGMTRLTGSGLSMVDWGPLGQKPPTSQGDWDALFQRYQGSPQYQQVNAWMTLEDFKKIFWWEYIHRQLGRLIGLVYGLPWLWFAFRGHLRGRLLWLTGAALLLGGLQGVVGWWMVKSGLVDRPEVSHFRLAVHLGLALFLAAFVLWLRLGVVEPPPERPTGIRRSTVGWIALLAVQLVYGAFMAGKRAGWRYTSFPDMDGAFVPEGAFATPTAIVDDGATIHFIHRTLAYLLCVAAGWWWWRVRRVGSAPLTRAATWVVALLFLQFAIGVATIMNSVPLPLAALHQSAAFALLSASVVALYRT